MTRHINTLVKEVRWQMSFLEGGEVDAALASAVEDLIVEAERLVPPPETEVERYGRLFQEWSEEAWPHSGKLSGLIPFWNGSARTMVHKGISLSDVRYDDDTYPCAIQSDGALITTMDPDAIKVIVGRILAEREDEDSEEVK